MYLYCNDDIRWAVLTIFAIQAQNRSIWNPNGLKWGESLKRIERFVSLWDALEYFIVKGYRGGKFECHLGGKVS